MAQRKRKKDQYGNILRKGETQRKDKRYIYQYTDKKGKRHTLYARSLISLRQKEDQVVLDRIDNIDTYIAGNTTVNYLIERYLRLKSNLLETTKANYQYIYEHFIKEGFGEKIIGKVKYSDVREFYFSLAGEDGLSPNTVGNVNVILRPAFGMAVKDDIIRHNPTDGIMKEVMAAFGKNRGVRHALTIEQQRAFLNFVRNDPIYSKWDNLFTFMFGTGVRFSEVVGLCWQDIDFEKDIISIKRAVVYKSHGGDIGHKLHDTKTRAGCRSIPMLNEVREALEDEYRMQSETGFNNESLDGVEGFIFKNRFGGFLTGSIVNRTIKGIVAAHNRQEELIAAKEGREPLMIPYFSCHIIRHTFATHLCETNTNIKSIQSIMGHANIETTMDVYAEATERKKRDAIEKIDGEEYFF